jgi:glycosyltransferase EpsE
MTKQVNQTMHPTVSVIMATYNDLPEYLKISIGSIQHQTMPDWELLILDDSSSLETKELLDKIAKTDDRILVIRKMQKMGFVPALNIGIRLAKGKYIARMDGDDISSYDRLEKQIDFLERHIDIAVVGSRINIINKDGIKTSRIKFPISSGFRFRLFAMLRCPLQHGAILMRRELIDRGICYNESYKKAEDLELWLRLLKFDYKMVNLPEYLFSFRIENDYAYKRNQEHFKYNLRARVENFTLRYPITGLSGIIISRIYSFIPYELKQRIYGILNNH